MENHERLDQFLEYYFELYNKRDRNGNIRKEKEKYDLHDDTEIFLLENQLQIDGFIEVRVSKGGRRSIEILPRGIQFIKDGGYTRQHQLQLSEKQEQNRVNQEESAARQATINQAIYAEDQAKSAALQAEYAKKAFILSGFALVISVIAIIVAIFD